ncbi:MAG TPA: glucose-6-phosphate isomerase, partial [Planctomycetota bacterium]|nr:glucose-6-phosphate isomerase [Planctomycetota bacterium]
MPIAATAAWNDLVNHAATIKDTHLRDLLQDGKRCAALTTEFDGIVLDQSRQNATPETKRLLLDLASAAGLPGKLKAMVSGQKINSSEGRAVLHVALRAADGTSIIVDGQDVVPPVIKVQEQIKAFTDAVRSGKW